MVTDMLIGMFHQYLLKYALNEGEYNILNIPIFNMYKIETND